MAKISGHQDALGWGSSGGDPLPLHRVRRGLWHVHAAAAALPGGTHGRGERAVCMQAL